MKKTFFVPAFLLLIILVGGCDSGNKEAGYWNAPSRGGIDLKLSHLNLDTASINLDNTSGVGRFLIYRDTLVFVDELYSTLYLFDDNFNEVDSRFGRGDGPGELSGRIVGFAENEGRLIALGPSYDYYMLDIGSGKVLKNGLLRFDDESQNNPNEVMNNPRPEYKEIYEVDYPGLQLAFLNENEVIFTITTSHPLFNAFSHREFYESARVLAVLDIDSGKLSGIHGRMSPIYQSWRFLPYLSSVKIAGWKEKGFFLGFEADTLIYYFREADEPEYTFGNAGRSMKTDYEQVEGTEDYVQYYKELRPNYGFFTFLKHFSELDLLFRGYRKGIGEKMDGLQIYQGNVLIGDIDVPKGFRVIGFRDDKFYGEIKSEDGLSSEEIPVLVEFKW